MFKRKHSNKDKIKFEIPIVRYLVYLLILTLAVSGVSLSRYSVSSGTIQSGRVAKLAGSFTKEGSWTFYQRSPNTFPFDDVSAIPLGEKREYVITIQNLSEVAMRVHLIDANTGYSITTGISVVDAEGNSVDVDVDEGWFDFSPAGSDGDTRQITIELVSTVAGNSLMSFFEYQQID